jgi:hypothetical protein
MHPQQLQYISKRYIFSKFKLEDRYFIGPLNLYKTLN